MEGPAFQIGSEKFTEEVYIPLALLLVLVKIQNKIIAMYNTQKGILFENYMNISLRIIRLFSMKSCGFVQVGNASPKLTIFCSACL